jgi:cell division septum initiation protein DivIVA
MPNIGDGSAYFRESFRGFNKDDVINFMMKMSKEYEDNEAKYKEEIAESETNILKKEEEIKNIKQNTGTLKAEMQKKSEETAALHKKYTALCAEYERQKAIIDAVPSAQDSKKSEEEFQRKTEELNNKIHELGDKLKTDEAEKEFLRDVIKKFELETGLRTADICDAEVLETHKISFENDMMDMAEAKKKITGFEKEIDTLKKENAELLEIRNSTQELSSDEQKIYETITADLGNVIYSAKKTAETIVEKAKAEADDILNKANMKRAIFFEEYEKDVAKLKEKYKLIYENYEKVKDDFKNAYEIYCEKLITIDQDIKNVYEKL